MARRVPDVLNGGHGQEVIDTEHVALVHQFAAEAIERSRASEVLTERLLEDHLAVRGEPGPVERRDRGREDRRGQREVDRNGALTGEARRNAVLLVEIDPSIARRAEQRFRRGRVDAGGAAFQPTGGPGSELLVAPVLAAGANELEPRGEVPTGLEGSQAGEQVPTHQVARGTEDDEPVDHVRALAPPSRV